MGVSFDDAWRNDIEPVRGGWIASREKVRRKISALTRNAEVFWIGIASNGIEGCRDRWNAKYRDRGMTNMTHVYVTSSEQFRRNLERDMIEFYEEHCDNTISGGGGPNGTSPFSVYVAWRNG